MYLRNGLIRFLNVKNNILLFASVFFVVVGVIDLLSLFLHYYNDFETIKRAKSTPGSLMMIAVGLIAAIVIMYLKRKISNARFYSGKGKCGTCIIMLYHLYLSIAINYAKRRSSIKSKHFDFQLK